MTERIWSLIGKILSVLLTAVTLIYIFFQLTDRFKVPSLYGTVEFQNCSIHPKIRDMMKERIETKFLSSLIDEQKKKGKSAKKILEAIETNISDNKKIQFDVDLNLNQLELRPMILVKILNNGSQLARDVKLILPSKGIAEISEVGLTEKTTDWSGQVLIGDIRPDARIEVKVWPESLYLPNLQLIKPAIVHSNGTGKLMEVHRLYGWDADVVAWFLTRTRTSRLVTFLILLTGIATVVWLAIRRRHRAEAK